jgi:hypothetical protein
MQILTSDWLELSMNVLLDSVQVDGGGIATSGQEGVSRVRKTAAFEGH